MISNAEKQKRKREKKRFMQSVMEHLPPELWGVFTPQRNWTKEDLQEMERLKIDFDRKLLPSKCLSPVGDRQALSGNLLCALCQRDLEAVLLSAIIGGLRCGLLSPMFKIFLINYVPFSEEEIKQLLNLILFDNVLNVRGVDLMIELLQEYQRGGTAIAKSATSARK